MAGIYCKYTKFRRCKFRHFTIFDNSAAIYFRRGVQNPPEFATPIQLCVGSWSSGIGSFDVMRTRHTSARPVSRQGTIVFDPRVPATPRVPFGCVRYYDAKIRFRSTKTRESSNTGSGNEMRERDQCSPRAGARRFFSNNLFCATFTNSAGFSKCQNLFWFFLQVKQFRRLHT